MNNRHEPCVVLENQARLLRLFPERYAEMKSVRRLRYVYPIRECSESVHLLLQSGDKKAETGKGVKKTCPKFL